MLSGVVASGGIGIGKAIVVEQYDLVVRKKSKVNPKREKARFAQAVCAFTEEINQATCMIRRTAGKEEADILQTQIAIVNDPELRGELDSVLDRDCVNAEYAFYKICDRYIRALLLLESEIFRSRAADLRDVKNHMLSLLMGIEKIDLSLIPEGSVIVTNDIAPSHTACIDPRKIRGIVTQSGALCSHTAMISKAMGLPTLVAVDGLLDCVRDGDTLIVDAEAGSVVRNPEPHLLARYRQRFACAV